MNVFIQGMRRSGTTVVFDLFVEDGRFDCYYEPLAHATGEARGGGSGIRTEDFFAKVRRMRELFVEQRWPLKDPLVLNYGAPRDPPLEFETSLPDYVRAYIQFMCEQAEDTAIKFTRMGCKVPVLHEIEPRALFVHVVRDPRAVATSHLYGKDQMYRSAYDDKEFFFTRRSKQSRWSSYAFSEALLARDEYMELGDLHDFERVLLVWKHLARATHEAGRSCFGDRYHILRHEDLLSDPRGTVGSLYEALDEQVPEGVVRWARDQVRGRSGIHDAESAAWIDAIGRLGMATEMSELGYELDGVDAAPTKA